MGSMDGMPNKIVNFAAGPAKLPEEVCFAWFVAFINIFLYLSVYLSVVQICFDFDDIFHF